MLTAMLLMTFAFWAYAFAVVFMRTRAIVLEREQHTEWVAELVRRQGSTGMNWNSASEFFAMGGYGLYVWGSYGVGCAADGRRAAAGAAPPRAGAARCRANLNEES